MVRVSLACLSAATMTTTMTTMTTIFDEVAEMATKDKARGVNASRILAGLAEVVEIAEGRAEPARVFVPEKVDVKTIRKAQGLSQAAFAGRYGFSLASVQDWEQGRRQPEAAARVLLKVIEKRPDAVQEALAD